MRQSFHALLVLSIASLTVGCQQAPNASSPLAPVGTLMPTNQVPARSASTGIGPFGGRTRIAPPGTGSYAVPNNYMGATAPVGQFGSNEARVDSFNRVGAAPDGGVRPAGFAEASPFAPGPTSGTGFNNQAKNNLNSSAPMTPQLGGMRVHDLTNAPAPPGYRSNLNVPNPGYSPTQGGYQSQPQPTGQFYNGGPPVTNQYQQQNNFQQSAPQGNNVPARVPNFIPGAQIAGAPATNQPAFSIARSPETFTREVPMQPSPMQPSFRGAAQFPSTTPSTDPINNNPAGQPANLPWRRPTSAY